MSTAIIGAGAAGLSLALMLDDDVTIFERSDGAGGLCRSYSLDGYTFDTGPHILGGIPRAVEWICDHTEDVDYRYGETNNVGWWGGQFVKHPFEDEAVGNAFMRKMWKTEIADLEKPGLAAQAGRLPGGVKRFLYPRRGGYQAITDSWARQLEGKINYLAEISETDAMQGFERVVWCAPLESLRYNSLVTVTLGFKGTAPAYTAIYEPGATPFHRITFPGNFSPSNVPEGHFLVQGEISVRHDDEVDQLLVDKLLELLAAMDITRDPGDFGHIAYERNAYPVPVAGQEKRAGLGGIYYHGRSGGHRYLNLDGVVDASMTLANHLNRQSSVSYGRGDDLA